MTDEKNCIDLFELLTVCEGDKIEVIIRGGRSMITIRGTVISIGNHALVVSARNGQMAIRYSEIKMVKKVEK